MVEKKIRANTLSKHWQYNQKFNLNFDRLKPSFSLQSDTESVEEEKETIIPLNTDIYINRKLYVYNSKSWVSKYTENENEPTNFFEKNRIFCLNFAVIYCVLFRSVFWRISTKT